MNDEIQTTENQSPLEASPLFTTPPPPAPWETTTIDTIFGFVFYFIGYLYIKTFPQLTSHGVGALLFVCFYAFSVIAYLLLKERKIPKSSWFWFGVLLLMGISFLLFYNDVFSLVNSLFLHCVAVYWTMSASDALIESQTSSKVLLDGLRGVFVLPFIRFTAPIVAIINSVKKTKKNGNGKKFFGVFLGIIICVPILFIILPLLSASDQSFESLLNGFSFGAINTYEVINIFLAFFVGFYLFSLIYSADTTDKPDNQKLERSLLNARILPNITVRFVLSTLIFVYAIFIASIISTLISTAKTVLPAGETYSSFARSGFFELCLVVVITLIVLITSVCFTKSKLKENKPLRILIIIICVESLLLIATAMTKMLMYIGVYGLTPKRFFTTAFMVFLTFVFIMIIIRVFKEIKLVKIAFCSFCACFAILCCVNVSGIITEYNVYHYNSHSKELGSESALDSIIYNSSYSPDSHPTLTRFRNTLTDKRYKNFISEEMEMQNAFEKPWNFTISEYIAINLRSTGE